MIEVTTGCVHSAAGRLWWKRLDPSTGAVPIVLLHGGPGMPSYYLEPFEALADERPVIFYDQLGCGRSDLTPDPSCYTLASFVADLHTLTDALGLRTFHLLGHSWGGMLALAYTASSPERVASLVLSSPLVDVAAWCEDAADLVQRLPESVRRGIEDSGSEPGIPSPAYRAAEAEFYRRHFCRLDPWPETLQRTMAELGTESYETMWGPNEFTLAGNLRGQNLSSVVEGLTVPNLWLCGSEDEARPTTVRRFSELNPLGRYGEFPGGTHCGHLEQSADYIAAVRRFLLLTPGL